MRMQFPFRILGFHSDKSSEFIDHTVCQAAEPATGVQTKSRSVLLTMDLIKAKTTRLCATPGYGYIDSGNDRGP
jgi:hypothetical protein